MLSLFHCVSCRAPVAREHFPLCADCASSLRSAPPLCPRCAHPACAVAGECLRPWVEDSGIRAFHARYLCVNPGYGVLKAWKKRGGPAFDHRVLAPDSALEAKLELLRSSCPECVIPVPQRFPRAWQFGGSSPAAKVAGWVSGLLGIPLREALRPPARQAPKRQAELQLRERLANAIEFELDERELPSPGAGAVLVDDFMTTGHTLRRAARALRRGGVGRLEVFCLGIRPGRIELTLQRNPEREAHLRQGA